MSDERLAQARAEAERRWPLMGLDEESRVRSAFRAGVVWADANPKPHTITRSELAHVAWMLQNLPEDRIAAMLPGLLGIEVTDDA